MISTETNAPAKRLPPELCKFRTYGSREGDKDTVYRILQGRIRFAALSTFNDPFEGRPCIVPSTDNPAHLRKIVEDSAIEARVRMGMSFGDARKEALELLSGHTPMELFERARQSMHDAITKEWLRVCCFSEIEVCAMPLSWAHYANDHSGICIHFRTDKAPFTFAYPVRYQSGYPMVAFPRGIDSLETFERTVLTKCDQWSYEREWRLIRPVTDGRIWGPAEHLMVDWDGDIAVFDPVAVSAVTLGVRMGNSEEQELRTWIEKHAPHVKIWKAALHDERFELTRHPA